MRVAHGNGKSVCRIVGLGRLWQPQKRGDHSDHLFFFGSAISDNCLLDLQRRIFRNSDAVLDTRKQNHTACLSSEGAVSANMEKVLSKNPGNEAAHIKAEFVMEINMNHPIAAKLKELFENDKDKLAKYSKVLYAQARLVSGLSIENPAEVSDLVCNLMLQ